MQEEDENILPPKLSHDLSSSSSSDHKIHRILHLLSAAADSLSSSSSHKLASVILLRLRQLLPPSDPPSPTPHRLASLFTVALLSLLPPKNPTFRLPLARNRLSALQFMHYMSPHSHFSNFTLNQSILDSTIGFHTIHIIDFDIRDGIQWPSLIQALFSRKNCNFSSPELRITAVAAGKRSPPARVRETGRRLAAFAGSVGLRFSFRCCRVRRREGLRRMRAVEGEVVVLNCVVESAESVAAAKVFVGGAGAVGARLVTVVEEESGGGEVKGFKGRFVDEMERYWAIMEGLEEEFREQRRAREMVEKEILAPRIAAALRKAYYEKEEEEEEGGGVGEWMAARGFVRADLSKFNVSQAWMLTKLFNGGYQVEEECSNKLVLRWKSRRLVSASSWSVPPPSKRLIKEVFV